MTEEGRLGKLQGDVDNLKLNFAKLDHDMETMSATLSSAIEGVRDAVFARFDKFFELQNQTRPDIYKTLGTAVGVAGVTLIIIGAFASLAKTNLDTNISFTNEKIATSNAVIKENFAGTNNAIRDIVASVKSLQDTTIPRSELEYRLTYNRDAINRRVEKETFTEVTKRTDSEIAAITSDIQRIKDGQVSRAEHEQHWKQYDDRLNLISNRLSEVARSTTGASANDQITKLQDQVQALTNKFITIPGDRGK